MAAALGIGRFVYTPILPVMLTALGWSKSDAGIVASANFIGYLIGAMLASLPFAAARPRWWLVAALVTSSIATAAMALSSNIVFFVALRFIGGAASAFVIVCASTLVLEQLALSGRHSLSGVHFAGVGLGIMLSALAVSTMLLWNAGWTHLWIGAGVLAASATVMAAILIPHSRDIAARPQVAKAQTSPPGIGAMILAYGLFGFGYVITATFLIAIVRLAANVNVLEPWVWIIFGLAAIPSVSVWGWLGQRIGIFNAFALACALEALGVAASVEWVTVPGIAVATLLLGGTFMGITALGFVAGRTLAAGNSQQALGRMTASFSLGQIAGPVVAGFLSERLGDFRLASLIAAAALVGAAALSARTSWLVAAHAVRQKTAASTDGCYLTANGA
ncbi:MAG TPA: YbfB/YjiJ family MFS transporter [Bradyrhizobium sp.]|uniref:YbfB/YjiJ family MFS transporter n=1 Tax=Bradyrhizobium sp. TaxID=376 RepID=UPI002D8037F3|nr:YbfB/YjiJ family MFS transporter [Bradyrhizobium sp.]HET7884885.1 YbfB/YjiJ family MFS transporter [Bradyrhizobium sp.]